jgi:glucokinase
LKHYLREEKDLALDLYIGVDLGGTKTKAVLANGSLEIIREKTIPTQMDSTETILKSVLNAVDAVWDTEEIKAIGVGTPGQLDRKRGIAIQAPSMGWSNVPLAQFLSNRYGVPTYIENDINVAALGEFSCLGESEANAVYVNVGTGIGAGIILSGKLFLGNHGNSGEFGHLTMEPMGPLCNCGNRGCLEAIAAGPAIGARATQWARARKNSQMHSLALERELTAKEVSEFARSGDPLAIAVLEETGMYLGRGIADLVCLFDPGMVIFGGSVILNSPYVWDAMLAEAEARLMPIIFTNTAFLRARLGGDSGAIGAVVLARERSREDSA